jgi:methionyl aminopeptidase
VVHLKGREDIEKMRKAGAIVARVLHEIAELVRPGVTTGDLDLFAQTRTKELGAKPAFKGYHGFPGTLCVSVNEEVVHGIPSKKRVLREGDIVGVDFGVSLEGWFGDSARTFAVGKVTPDAQRLLEITEKSLYLGIEQAVSGNHLFNIGHAIQNFVEGHGYSVVREFVGHGIGKSLHEDPQVPNFGIRGKGMILKPGMVIAIEPMINAGKPEVRVLADGWTAVTADKKLSAHFEHTVAITETGTEILTKPV